MTLAVKLGCDRNPLRIPLLAAMLPYWEEQVGTQAEMIAAEMSSHRSKQTRFAG